MSLRQVTAQMGSMMLTQEQHKFLALPNILTLFRATGISESERMELGIIMQRFIAEGFVKGLNIPQLLQGREIKEGKLQIGFTDSPIHGRNTIQLDRGFWRTRPDSQRVSDFLNRLGTRLTSPYNRREAPTNPIAVRHFREPPRTGDPRRPYAQAELVGIARRVQAAISPTSLQKTFQNIQQFQTAQGIERPKLMQETPAEPISMAYTQALKAGQDRALAPTRHDMIDHGADPLTVQSMQPRSGIASPKGFISSPVQQAMARAEASGRPQRALIWGGGGAWYAEAEEAKRLLSTMNVPADIVTSLSGVDYSKYATIIVPGGNANSEYYAMGSTEAERLKQAVQGGLNYMGHCAGAFLAGEYGSWGLGLTDVGYDVEWTYNTGSFLNDLQNIPGWDANKDRYLMEQGGPVLTPGGGTVLATFPNGDVSMKLIKSGSGDVLLTSSHPAMEGSNDPDGSDDELYMQLLKMVMGGSSTPTTNTNTTNITVNPPTVTPWGGEMGGLVSAATGDTGAATAPVRKTPVAGMLPENIIPRTFATALQGMMGRASPMLSSLAGALQKKAV